MENKKLTQEEIEKLTSLQQKSNNILAEFGNLEVLKLQMESRKNDLINFYNEAKTEETEFGKELSEKYGDGTIDLAKGEFIPNK
jgi:hypothetical protein